MSQATQHSIRKMLRNVVGSLLLGGWLTLVVFLTLVGVPLALVGWPTLLQGAGTLLLLTVGGMGVHAWWKRRKLAQLAKTSLATRAVLAELELDYPVRQTLESFDEVYHRTLVLLAEPAIDTARFGLSAEADLRALQEHVWNKTRALARVEHDLRELATMTLGADARSVVDEMRHDAGVLREELKGAVADTQQLWERLLRLRQLSDTAARPGTEPDASLREALEEVDRALDAVRELDDVRARSAENRARQIVEQLQRESREGGV